MHRDVPDDKSSPFNICSCFIKAGKGLDQSEVVRFFLDNGEFSRRSLKIPDVLPIKENNWVVDDGLFRLSGGCL